jgi:Domain of unknown function (DUF4136)
MRTFPKHVVALAATLALVAGLVAPAGAKVKIKTEYEKTQKFDGIKTWTWLEDPKVINKSTNPNVVNDGVINQEALSPPTKAAVEREMAAKGYRLVGAGEPADVQVAVWLIGSAGTSTQELGQFLPYYASFTLGMTSYGPAQSMRIYETGTIVFDIIDPARKSAIWRATASGEINRENSQEKRLAIVAKMVQDVLKKFPPK